MTSDQLFAIGLIAQLVTLVGVVLTALRGNQTHSLVNGMSKRRVRQARAEGARAAKVAAPPMTGPQIVAAAAAELAAHPPQQ